MPEHEAHGRAISPGATSGRLAAAAIGGLAGGLAFGVIMLTDAVVSTQELGRTGLVTLLQTVLGIDSPLYIWTLHAIMSILVGVVFGMLVRPTSYVKTTSWAVVYTAVVGLVTNQLALRALAGEALAADLAAWQSVIGHLVYGLALGLIYVWFYDLEVREAGVAESGKAREWSRRERGH